MSANPRVSAPAHARRRRTRLRVFCHAHGNKLILLLGGYDKGEDTAPKRQDKEIALARKRLTDWRLRRRRRPS